MSDLHLEFGEMVFPEEQDTDADTVLVLAGDVAVAGTKTQYVDFILQSQKQFKHVIWIMGNHEHYGGSISRSIAKIKRNLVITRAMEDFINISIVEDEVVSIDDVDFVCSTLWTDYSNQNPMVMMSAQMQMNDFKKIRMGKGKGQDAYSHKLTPTYLYNTHINSRKFIENSIAVAKENDRKVVVVTHHGPSYQSLAPEFHGDDLNGAYVSPLDMMIEDLEPDYWIHGHLHNTNDYNIGKTNILCNPRGYALHELNLQFDPLWTIDLS